MAFTIDEEKMEKNEKQSKEIKQINLEDAIQLIGFGKFHYYLVSVSGLFMAAAFYETMSINYILPISECDLDITSKQQYGIVSGVWFAGIILTSHGWGFLSDTYGRRKILIISSLCAFTTSLFSSLSMNFIQMVIFRFLNGFFISGVSGTIYAYLGEFLDAKSRSRSMMVSSFIYGVACIALPLLAMVIINEEWSFEIPILNIDFKPWRLFILICSLQSLLSGILLWNCPESPRYTYSCKKDEQWTMKIFDRIQIINFGRIKHDFKLTPIVTSEMEGTCDKSVVKMMKDQLIELTFKYPRSFMIMSVLQFGTYFVCNGLLIFFPDILNQTASLSGSNIQMCDIVEAAIANKTAIQTLTDVKICVEKFDISVYYFVIYLESCYVIGFFLISILLWMKLKRLIILNFIFFTTGVCGILITYIPNVTVSSYLFVWLLTAGLNVNLLNTITYELFPTHLRALAMGLSMMIGRLGALVGGNIAGILLEAFCGETFFISGSLMILSGILVFIIPNIFSSKAHDTQ